MFPTVTLFGDSGEKVLVTLIAAGVAAVVAIAVNVYMNRGHNERFVYGQVQKIIEFAIAYPYLEDDEFCLTWPNTKEDPKGEMRQRYEHYCCHLFNTMERVYELCQFDLDCMKKYLYPDEMIVRHKTWWRHDPENIHGYTDEFQIFVNQVIKKHEGAKS